MRLLGEQTSKGTWASAQMKAQQGSGAVGHAEMDCGVQVEVSKVLLLLGVVMGGGVVVVRQLQALEMRWCGGLVGWERVYEGGLDLRKGRRLRCRLVRFWC